MTLQAPHVDVPAFVARLAEAGDGAAMEAALRSSLASLELDGFTLFSMLRPTAAAGMLPAPDIDVPGLPASLEAAYAKNGWADGDPIWRVAMSRGPAVTTEAVFSSLDLKPVQRRMWDAMRDNGIEHELNIPLSSGDRLRQISIHVRGGGATARRRFALGRIAGQHLATVFLWAYEAVVLPQAPAAPSRLAPRETDCLSWCAHGKSADEIAVILGLSVHTVRHYQRNAIHKLGAANATQAVAIALKNRLIEL